MLLLLLGAAASTLILSIFVNADDEIKAIADNKITAVLILLRMAGRVFLSILVFVMVSLPIKYLKIIFPIVIQISSRTDPHLPVKMREYSIYRPNKSVRRYYGIIIVI